MRIIKRAPKNTPVEYFGNANVFEFEDYMIEGTDGSEHALGAAFALAGIPDKHFIRLSARQQRMLWGDDVIGKKAICLRNGRFEIVWSSGFGQDREICDLIDYVNHKREMK